MRTFLVLPLLLALLAPAAADAKTKTKRDKLNDVTRSSTHPDKLATSVDIIRYTASYRVSLPLQPELVLDVDLKNVVRYTGNGKRQQIQVAYTGADGNPAGGIFCNGGHVACAGKADFDAADDSVHIEIPVEGLPKELTGVGVTASYTSGWIDTVTNYGVDFGPRIKHLKL